MPANNVRLGGAYFTFTADTRPYEQGAARAIAANQRLAVSYNQFGRQLARNQLFLSQFSQSLRSSLVATLAYAAGARLLFGTLGGVVGGFLDYDQALIRISKTTGIAGETLERLGESIVAIGTEGVGDRRALAVLREDLFNIAVAAGQAGLTAPSSIERITRAAAALQSSSNLIGTDAVRALTRYLQVTNQGIERTDAIASAFVHLGNNIVGTEAEIARFSTRTAQNLSAVGAQSDAVILGISATLLEAGIEIEAAGTALQRAQVAILANAGDPSRFQALGTALGGTVDEVEALRQRFEDGTATAEDYDRALLALFRTISDLTPTQRQPFIADFFGTGESNVRITRVIGALANDQERLERNIGIANEALETQDAHFDEAERASEAYRARLQVVGEQLKEQATTVGEVFVPALVAMAEQFRLIEAAALAAAVALGTGFGRRRLAAIQATNRELREQAAAQVASAQRQAAATRLRVQAREAEVRALNSSRQIGTQAVNQQAAAQAVLSSRIQASSRAQRELTRQQERAARVSANFAQLGRPSQERAAAGVAAARREFDRRQAAVGAAQREVVRLQTLAAANTASIADVNRATRRYDRAVQRADAATAKLADAQANLARHTRTVAQRLRSLGAGIFTFLGGPLGLFLAAITAAPLLVGAFSSSLSGLRKEADDLKQSLQELADAQAQEAAGLTDTGATGQEARELLQQLRSERDEIFAELSGREGAVERAIGRETNARIRRQWENLLGFIRGEIDSIDADLIARAGTIGIDPDALRQLVDNGRDIAEIEALLERLGLTAADAGEAVTAAGDRLKRTFDRLPASVLAATQAVRAFNQSLADGRRDALDLARLDLSLVGASPALADFERLVFEEGARINAQVRANERALTVARENQEQAVRRLAAAEAERNSIALGTEARKEAEQQVAALERQVASTGTAVALARERLRLSQETLIAEEDLAEIARARATTRIAQFRDETRRQTEAVAPDADQVLVDALRRELELKDQLAVATRDLAQTRRIDAEASVAEQQALRAFYEQQSAFADELRRIRREQVVTEYALARARRTAVEASAAVEAAGIDVSDALLAEERAALAAVAALEAQQIELRLSAEAHGQSAEAAQAHAEAMAELARQAAEAPGALANLTDEAGRLRERLEDVAADGFGRLGDALTDLVTTGKADFADLANSIISDLVRVLIRAQVIAPLVQALTGGEGLSGGLFGSIFGGFHTGGIAPDAPQRLSRPRGLRGDELFAVLQKGEIVLPRELAARARAGDMEALQRWLARLPRYHEGGMVGGGSIIRADIIELRGAIQALTAAVARLESRLLQIETQPREITPGLPPGAQISPAADGRPVGQPGRFVDTPPGMGGKVERFLDDAKEEVEGFAGDASNTLRGFFLEDVPNFVERSRQFVDRQLSSDDPIGPQSRNPPYAGLFRVTREFERQRERDAERERERLQSEQRAEEGELRNSVQELLDRAREQTEREREQLRRLQDSDERINDTQIFEESVRTFADAVGALPQPGRAFESGIPAGERSWFRAQSQEFQDTVREIRDRAQRPGDPSEFNRLRELVDRIEVDVPPLPRYRREPLGPDPLRFETASFGGFRRVADTPRPDLLPEAGPGESIRLFREASDSAFSESATALTNTFGATGVMGAVMTGDTTQLLEGVFSQGGLMGQLVGESEGLMGQLFGSFGSGLSQVLSQALGGLGGGGGGIFSALLGGLFGFHEGGDVSFRAPRYHRPVGLRSDELFAVLQRGEIVIPKPMATRLRHGGPQDIAALTDWISRLPRFHEGGVVGSSAGASRTAGASGGWTVQILNESRQRLEVPTDGVRVDWQRQVIQAVVRDFRDGGPASKAARQTLLGRR